MLLEKANKADMEGSQPQAEEGWGFKGIKGGNPLLRYCGWPTAGKAMQ